MYVDSNIAGKLVGDTNTQQVAYRWPGDDESILPIVTWIIDKTIVSTLNGAITGLPDLSWNPWKLRGCQDERNGDGGPQPRNVTPIFHNNTAAGWVQATKIWNNPTLFCVVCHGQQADCTAGAQTPICGGHSYPPLDDILPLPAEDMIDDIGGELGNDAETQRRNQSCFRMTKTSFQKFEWTLPRRIFTQPWYLEVIWHCGVSLYPDY